MGIIDINQETQYDVIAIISTLQHLLEAAQTDNHKLKQNLSDQQHQYQQYVESKTNGIIQENNILCMKQDQLETDLYTKGQALDEEKKATQYWKRLYDALEKSLHVEREEFDKDRQLWMQRESQLTDQIRLQQQQHKSQKGDNDRSANQKHTVLATRLISDTKSMKNHDGYCLKDTALSCQQSINGASFQQHLELNGDHTSLQDLVYTEPPTESPNNTLNQDIILSLEKRIAELKSDLEKQITQLQRQHSLDSRQINDLVDQISSMKQLNQSLMEENEGYRILLLEKTISGDFITDSIGKLFDGDDSSADYDSNTNQQHASHDTDKINMANNLPSENQALNLADELALASSTEKNTKENDLLTEIKTLQDENRALQLYMNKILLRIIESKHSESLLSIDDPNNKQQTAFITKPISPSSSSSASSKGTLDPRKTKSCLALGHTASTVNDSVLSDSSRRDDGDSWSHIFKRMGGGLGGWTKANHTETGYIVDHSLGIEVEKSLV